MIIEKALEILEPIKVHCVDNPQQEIYKAIGVGIKSLEAWNKVIRQLDVKAFDLYMREDGNASHIYAQGIMYAVSVIRGHLMQEVESEVEK